MIFPSGQKPVLKNIPPEIVVFNEKEDITLSLEFEGKPTPSVKWYHDGIEVIDGKNNMTIATETGKSSKLVIKKQEASVHTGLYSCRVGNEAGEAVCETRIIKQDVCILKLFIVYSSNWKNLSLLKFDRNFRRKC